MAHYFGDSASSSAVGRKPFNIQDLAYLKTLIGSLVADLKALQATPSIYNTGIQKLINDKITLYSALDPKITQAMVDAIKPVPSQFQDSKYGDSAANQYSNAVKSYDNLIGSYNTEMQNFTGLQSFLSSLPATPAAGEIPFIPVTGSTPRTPPSASPMPYTFDMQTNAAVPFRSAPVPAPDAFCAPDSSTAGQLFIKHITNMDLPGAMEGAIKMGAAIPAWAQKPAAGASGDTATTIKKALPLIAVAGGLVALYMMNK